MSYVLSGFSIDEKNQFAIRFTELKQLIRSTASSNNFLDRLTGATEFSQTTLDNNLARLDNLIDKAFSGDGDALPKIEAVFNGIYSALSEKNGPDVMASVGSAFASFTKDLAALVGSTAGTIIKSADLDLPSTSKLWGIAAVAIGVAAVVYYVKK